MRETITVVAADDHQLVLDAVEAAFELEEGIDVVATASSGEQLLRLVGWAQPNVVLLDLTMPGMDGLACLEQLRAKYRKVKVIVLSGNDDPRIAHQALRLGASAFVRKHVDPRDLAAVVRQTAEETVVSQLPHIQDVSSDVDAARAKLTRSEFAVLEALTKGRLNSQIAADLSVAQQTVKFHLTNIYRKLGVANRTEAIRYAYDHALVDAPSTYERVS